MTALPKVHSIVVLKYSAAKTRKVVSLFNFSIFYWWLSVELDREYLQELLENSSHCT